MKKLNWAQRCVITNLERVRGILDDDTLDGIIKFFVKHPVFTAVATSIEIPFDIIAEIIKAPINLMMRTVQTVVTFDDEDYIEEES